MLAQMEADVFGFGREKCELSQHANLVQVS